MPHSYDHDVLTVLDAAGCQWASPRPWEPVPLALVNDGGIVLSGPAFIYRWENGSGPVKVSFLSRSEGRIQVDGDHLLSIEPGLGTIRLRVPGRNPMVLGAVEPAIDQQIGDLTSEAQSACQPHSDGLWSMNLILVSAAMRLVALTREAALDASGNDTLRTPRKEQIVSQLHEWLRPNLEHAIKLGDAAKQFNKSPRQLIRILKETTGTGFAEHLTMHRLTLARALLMRTGQSVIEIARAAGFNSREHFIRSFGKAFHWTPLQFRKAWNQASMGDSELAELCRVADRSDVEWLPAGELATSPEEGDEGEPHTLVVTNAMHEIVELFWLTPQGKRARIDVLERGGMVFVNRDNGGSCWLVRVPSSGLEACFRTPGDHAIAVVREALFAD